MNRVRITGPLLCKLACYLKTQEGDTQTKAFVKKWNPEMKNGLIFHNEKLLVPEEQTADILKLAVKQGMPLSRDGAFQWLSQRYYGFKRRDVGAFLNSIETVQLMKRRPYHNVRQNLTQIKEGTSQKLLQSRENGVGSVGIDLCFLPQKTKNYPKNAWSSDFKYLYVAVVQANNYTFAYPMTSKTAKEARKCAVKLYRDFRDRYGFDITGLSMDAGTEFQKDHLTFWRSKNIVPKLLSKVFWVETRNSVLMRNIAALREGMKYSWDKSLALALEKTNNTYNRKIRAIPATITGTQLKQGLKKFNLALPERPSARKQPVYDIGDRVRVLTKSAMDVNTVLWKSYNAFRDPKTHIWTKTISKITQKKRKGRTMQYMVRDKWYYPWQIQRVTKDLVKIEVPSEDREKRKPLKKSALQSWMKKSISKKPPVRKTSEPGTRRITRSMARAVSNPPKKSTKPFTRARRRRRMPVQKNTLLTMFGRR